MDSEISGTNTTVAQIQAQLENANWELSQTTIRAPADGYVTLVTISVGGRASQQQGVMSFIVENKTRWLACFLKTVSRPSRMVGRLIPCSTICLAVFTTPV
jgi:multidrug resistance efflux pump